LLPGDVFHRHGNAPKSFSAEASPRTPLGELTALPRPPSWWGGGRPPLPKNPPRLGPLALRASGFGPMGLAVSSPKGPGK